MLRKKTNFLNRQKRSARRENFTDGFFSSYDEDDDSPPSAKSSKIVSAFDSDYNIS